MVFFKVSTGLIPLLKPEEPAWVTHDDDLLVCVTVLCEGGRLANDVLRSRWWCGCGSDALAAAPANRGRCLRFD